MAVTFSPEEQAALLLTQARRNKAGSMNFPGVRQSWQDDELTGIANNLLQQGQSTAPVASGGWGYAEGLSRLGSGALGGLWAGKQRRKYEAEADARAREYATLYKGGQAQPAGAGAGNMSAFAPPDPVAQTAQALTQGATPQAPTVSGAPPGNFTRPPAQGGPMPSAAMGQTMPGGSPSPVVANATAVPTSQPQVGPRVLTPGESASPAGSRRRVGTRATRNNNPGNVKASSWTKQQPGYVGQDSGGFAIFDSVENGAKAQQALLRNYGRQGRNTIATIVPKWAPASDNNNVQAYVSAVSRATGIDPNKPLTDADIPAVQAAMAKHEGFGGPGGGTGVAVAGGGGGGASGGASGGTVEPWAVPDLPAAPARPEMPQIAEIKPSARRLLAERLMAGGDAMFPLMQANLAAGMEEEADLNKQREENIAQLQTTGYQSDLQTYNQMVANLQEAGLDERQAYIAANIALRQQQLQNQGALDEQRLENEAKANAPGKPPPVWVGKAIVSNNTLIDKLRAAKAAIEARPESVGAQFEWMPDFVASRYDPDGVAARAALAEFTTTLIHDKTGSAQGMAEVARLKPYMPRQGDSPNTIGNKIDTLIKMVGEENQAIDEMFPGYNPRAEGQGGGETLKFDAQGNMIK